MGAKKIIREGRVLLLNPLDRENQTRNTQTNKNSTSFFGTRLRALTASQAGGLLAKSPLEKSGVSSTFFSQQSDSHQRVDLDTKFRIVTFSWHGGPCKRSCCIKMDAQQHKDDSKSAITGLAGAKDLEKARSTMKIRGTFGPLFDLTTVTAENCSVDPKNHRHNRMRHGGHDATLKNSTEWLDREILIFDQKIKMNCPETTQFGK